MTSLAGYQLAVALPVLGNGLCPGQIGIGMGGSAVQWRLGKVPER